METPRVPQYEASYLTDVVYGIEPMRRELALALRFLRVERKLGKEEIGDILCEKAVNCGLRFQIGHYLLPMAAKFLGEEFDEKWR